MELTGHDQKIVDDFARRVQDRSGDTPFAVVLIGSTARGTRTSRSDLDLLVVSDEELVLPKHHVPPLHVQTLTRSAFLDRLAKGDDFVAWSLRFGEPVVGDSYWNQMMRSPESKKWPEWRQKIPQAAGRLSIANALIRNSDFAAAAEEIRYSAGHTGRAFLLRAKVFPRSRPEMVSQLKSRGWQHLAEALETLDQNGTDPRTLFRIELYLKKLLLHLDKSLYRKCSDHHLRAEKLRNAPVIHPLVQDRVRGFMRVFLLIRGLAEKEAQKIGSRITSFEVRPALSHEDEDDSSVTVEIQVIADRERRFSYWEALSESVDNLATTLSAREERFLTRYLSIIVTHADAI